MNWTDERVERLKKLWAEGLSASQIAAQLGGVSRNAVIGKVHRLSLPGRAKAGGASPSATRPKRPVVVARPAAPEAVVASTAPRSAPQRSMARPVSVNVIEDSESAFAPETALAVTNSAGSATGSNVVVPMSRKLVLTQLTDRTCKWPIGDPMKDEFHFCGNDSPDSSPYCTFHAKLAYQPSAERRRAR
ncbi:GcrA cell cycle regulator [Rhizobium sp. Leaf384]|uniref:GcrA family cell cycle regulator n=1 Tax=unclassified Rhizobium TaxID=2613769 RepID=UPI00071372A9|nr:MULTISPECIES: GcrA family cell cycle regulator [unclassified Rhizobium]KQR77860.1 GcrA cell cycle regulator [Rhizobium sp. Leaf341]KQS81070.1 GcrA cell cycle regulator [Rhizobium sp. Leaf384]KQS86978.1 GcrA cell cycle regulator [Rhizobium sp. Leaf383]